ncbi:MAG: Flp pilus assembly protein CpaB [Acidimicrobiales bacterium]
MSSRRTLILIAAIAVGAIAAFALYNYVQGIEDRAYEDAERVEVFKVDRNIPQGFPGAEAVEERYIVRSEIPREFLPANAVNDPDQISGLVALNELSANQVLVDGMFVDPSVALISFAERIDTEEATVTISVDQVGGVAGLLVPGDKVNMLVSADLYEYPEDQLPPVETGPGTPDSPGLEFIEIPFDSHARYLYQAVEILAIGQSPVPQPGETVDAEEVAGQSGLITFAVPPEAVQRIVAASDIYLSLVNPEYEPRVLPMPDPYEVLPGEDPARLTPYGPGGRE